MKISVTDDMLLATHNKLQSQIQNIYQAHNLQIPLILEMQISKFIGMLTFCTEILGLDVSNYLSQVINYTPDINLNDSELKKIS